MGAEIIELDKQRECRCYIAQAHASNKWQQPKAFFVIEGMILDDKDAEIIGCMLAGEMTLKEAQVVIKRRLNVRKPV